MYENGTFYIESGVYIKGKLDSATCIRGRVTDKGVVDFPLFGAIWISAQGSSRGYFSKGTFCEAFMVEFFARLEYRFS